MSVFAVLAMSVALWAAGSIQGLRAAEAPGAGDQDATAAQPASPGAMEQARRELGRRLGERARDEAGEPGAASVGIPPRATEEPPLLQRPPAPAGGDLKQPIDGDPLAPPRGMAAPLPPAPPLPDIKVPSPPPAPVAEVPPAPPAAPSAPAAASQPSSAPAHGKVGRTATAPSTRRAAATRRGAGGVARRMVRDVSETGALHRPVHGTRRLHAAHRPHLRTSAATRIIAGAAVGAAAGGVIAGRGGAVAGGVIGAAAAAPKSSLRRVFRRVWRRL